MTLAASSTTVQDLGGGACASRLSGGRLFLQHGPINLIVHVVGASAAVTTAYANLKRSFPDWLSELAGELPRLRSREYDGLAPPHGVIARCMHTVVHPHCSEFVTCMAAVAGAVADHAIDMLSASPGVERAYVNNRGDIGLYLTAGTQIAVGVVPSLAGAVASGRLTIDAESPTRGIATSGWDGRSHSLGIADSVTVLAANAAAADVAATLIANAVNVEHTGVKRQRACDLDEDSDLGERLVTVHVPSLPDHCIDTALDAGLAKARTFRDRGLIHAAILSAQARWRVLDP